MFDLKQILAALDAEGVKPAKDVLERVVRRITNPAGCEKCGARTKVGKPLADGSLLTPAPKKEK
jgi:hypothetical protein